jgi:DNA-binding response OmpR family regulator
MSGMNDPWRALIVDDEAMIRIAAMRSLTQEGFVCDGAADGQQAAEKCQVKEFDVVVTDLRMPEVNGHRLIVDLLEKERPPAIIVLTGVPEPRIIRDLLVRGVDDVITKPANLDVLAAKAKALVRRRRFTLEASPTAPAGHSLKGADAASPERPTAADRSAQEQEQYERAEKISRVTTEINQLVENTAKPPVSFDIYRELSDCRLTLEALVDSLQGPHSLLANALELANRASYHSINLAAASSDNRGRPTSNTWQLLTLSSLMLIVGMLFGAFCTSVVLSSSDSRVSSHYSENSTTYSRR